MEKWVNQILVNYWSYIGISTHYILLDLFKYAFIYTTFI